MRLQDFGWTAAWQAELQAAQAREPALRPGRVVRAHALQVDVWTPEEVLTVHLPARRRTGEHRPAVGDWVGVLASERGQARLEAIFTRRTCFARRAAGRRAERQVIAANVDRVFVVSSLDGDFSPRRIERYLTAVADSGAEPVILLTKAGLCDDVQTAIDQARAVAPGIDVHALDVLASIASDAVAPYSRSGATVALVGSSGVGKSTLVNHWLGEERQEVGEVRDRDRRGQHTTVARELFHLPGGAMVIDTPGMRELALWVDPAALDRAFADIEALAAGCRFADCRHEAEPGCAVFSALETGDLDRARLDSYRSLRDEILRSAPSRRSRR